MTFYFLLFCSQAGCRRTHTCSPPFSLSLSKHKLAPCSRSTDGPARAGGRDPPQSALGGPFSRVRLTWKKRCSRKRCFLTTGKYCGGAVTSLPCWRCLLSRLVRDPFAPPVGVSLRLSFIHRCPGPRSERAASAEPVPRAAGLRLLLFC